MAKKKVLSISVMPELKEEVYHKAESEDKKVSAMLARIIDKELGNDTEPLEVAYLIELWNELSKNKEQNKIALKKLKQIIDLKGVRKNG